MNRNRRVAVALALLSTVVLGLSACSSSAPESSSEVTTPSQTAAETISNSPSADASDQTTAAQQSSTEPETEPAEQADALDPNSPLAQAAKAEGSLTLYTDLIENAANAQAKAFTDKYGVQVNVVRLAGATLSSRFLSEQDAGAKSADVVVIADPEFTKDAHAKGYTIAPKDADIPGYPWDFPEKFISPDSGSAGLLIQVAGIAYNTDLVSEQDVPKAWTDLLDPKWQGKIGIADPSNFVGYDAEWVVLEDSFGPEFLSDLGKQKLKLYQGGAPTVAAVGSGEVALGAAQLKAAITTVKDAGGPIAITVPDGPATGIVSSLMLSAKASSPNAAKLFAAYAMSPEGSEIPAKASNSLTPYDTADLPAEFVEADYVRGAAEQSRISDALMGKN